MTGAQREKNANRFPLYYIVRVFFCATALIAGIAFGAASFCSSTTSAATNGAELSTSKRPIFKKRKLKIAQKILNVEIADTDVRRAYGLMFKEKLGPDEGMLFVFESEEQRAFWMQNTLIPLSIGYFSRAKILNEVIDMQPAVMGSSRPKTYPSGKKAMFALEMNIGWYERNKIRPGVAFAFADN